MGSGAIALSCCGWIGSAGAVKHPSKAAGHSFDSGNAVLSAAQQGWLPSATLQYY